MPEACDDSSAPGSHDFREHQVLIVKYHVLHRCTSICGEDSTIAIKPVAATPTDTTLSAMCM